LGLANQGLTFLPSLRECLSNTRTNAPWLGDQALRLGRWRRALRAAGVRYRYPYQMRHTYASMMLSAGENPAWIARQMGHADWGMIRRTYARWMPDVEPNAGEKLRLGGPKILLKN
jgi:integrase